MKARLYLQIFSYIMNENEIMERFCFSLEDAQMSDFLQRTIQGSGAFRRFKDAVYQNGIENEWFAYRNEEYKEIAIDWCQENGIEFNE